MRNAMIAQQRKVAVDRERSTRQHDLGVRQRQRRLGRIDQAQQIEVLRPCRERVEMLPPNGEKNSRRVIRQRSSRALDISDMLPFVAGRCLPRLAQISNQRRGRFCAGRHGVAADLARERMRGVDHMGHTFLPDIFGEPVDAAKAADPRRQGLRNRRRGATSVGVDSRYPGSRKRAADLAGFHRAAQEKDAKDAHHV